MADKTLTDLTKSVVRIAESSPKVQGDVKDIRDVVCGSLVESVMSISKELLTINKSYKIQNIKSITTKNSDPKKLLKSTNNIEKTLNKILANSNSKNLLNSKSNIEKTLNKILASISKGGFGGKVDTKKVSLGSLSKPKKDDGLMSSIMSGITIVDKLKNISLKDFIGARTKVNLIKKLMDSSLKAFKKFKDPKEVSDTIAFVESSKKMVETLSSISKRAKSSKTGVDVLERVFFGKSGKGGLLNIFRKINKESLNITKSKKNMKNMLAIAGSMLVISAAMTGVALLGPTALIGAAMTAGIVWLLSKTFKLLSKTSKHALKGAITLAILSTSVILFAFGLKLMKNAVKDIKLGDVGIMIGSIVGIGLAVAGIGLLAPIISIGSLTMILMGTSLGLLSLSIMAFNSINPKKSIGNIKTAIGELNETFGLNKDGDKDKGFFGKIGDGLKNMAIGLLSFGSTFFTMGSILLAGFTLGLIKDVLESWKNYNPKNAIKNISTALNDVQEALGMKSVKEKKEEGLLNKIFNPLGGIFDVATSLFQMGSTFATMATIATALGVMNIVSSSLKSWENYSPKNAINNISSALNGVQDALGMRTNKEKKEGLSNKLKAGVKSALDLGSSLFEMGSTFATMATIATALGVMELIKKTLTPWDDYNGKKAIENISLTLSGITSTLLKNLNNNVKTIKSFKKFSSDFEDSMEHLYNGSKNTSYISKSIITLSDSIKVWNENRLKNVLYLKTGVNKLNESFKDIDYKNFYKKSNILGNLFKTVSKSAIKEETSSTPLVKSIKNINSLDIEKAQLLVDMFTSFSKLKDGSLFNTFDKSVNKFVSACKELINTMKDGVTIQTPPQEYRGDNGDIVSNTPVESNININNISALATAIANAIGNRNIRLDTSSLDIKLLAEGVTGNKVTLTLIN